MFHINHNKEHDISIITFSGKMLDGRKSIHTNKLISKLVDEKKKKVVLNLKEVELIDSSGLGIIVQFSNAIKKEGGQLKLAQLSKKVTHLLVITKLNTILEAHSTIDEAISSF